MPAYGKNKQKKIRDAEEMSWSEFFFSADLSARTSGKVVYLGGDCTEKGENRKH